MIRGNLPCSPLSEGECDCRGSAVAGCFDLRQQSDSIRLRLGLMPLGGVEHADAPHAGLDEFVVAQDVLLSLGIEEQIIAALPGCGGLIMAEALMLDLAQHIGQAI